MVPRAHVLRSPVVQFLATGLLTCVVLLVGTGLLSSRAARDEALTDAIATTEVLSRSVAEPAVPAGLVDGDPGAVDRFDRVALDRLLVRDVRRVKIWRTDGTVVYSDDVRLIGERFPLGADEREVLAEGGSDAEVSDLSRPENRYEARGEGLVEVYTRIVSPEGEPLLFEAYYSVSGIEARQAQVIGPFRRITLGALAVLVAVATALLWVLTRRVTRAAAERERLLRSAASASDAERRRIARDLHDGVVQDLAGSAFTVSALARESSGSHRTALAETGDVLRGSLRSLRSLLVEIHPPGLTADSLPAALEDLTAPARAAGVDATVRVTDGNGADEQTVALVWRVAQESVRNTLRHARARTLVVDVTGEGPALTLEVRDDGVGFDPAAVRPDAHYGLRGLDSLVRDSGGRLDVRSAPGAGTTVRLEVGR
jgi:two-component system, NarL family, sensor kinase